MSNRRRTSGIVGALGQHGDDNQLGFGFTQKLYSDIAGDSDTLEIKSNYFAIYVYRSNG